MLASVKGVGEPYWERDFPVIDEMAEIMNCPRAAERVEFEIFNRMNAGGVMCMKESQITKLCISSATIKSLIGLFTTPRVYSKRHT